MAIFANRDTTVVHFLSSERCIARMTERTFLAKHARQGHRDMGCILHRLDACIGAHVAGGTGAAGPGMRDQRLQGQPIDAIGTG